ncbi:hypothetical protein JYU34_005354 [Plutella xylostella]|uniref:DUF4817 domain-containing protein n=1 Tax=Plutella xylostella TaxID=51655 RepID=A0ABQ7QWG7_PLUXY|nr:hypothetical protein JYU34_005354 [Plutella xylostella]
MAVYTNGEYYYMVMCVGECRGNLRAARELYRDRYVVGLPAAPRRLPSYPCFGRLVNRLHTTGSVRERNPGGRPVADRHGVSDEHIHPPALRRGTHPELYLALTTGPCGAR